MSAIGDYINLTAWGYEDKYDNTTHSKLLNGYTKTTRAGFNSALFEERQRINSAVSSITNSNNDEVLERFEIFYNKLLNNNGSKEDPEVQAINNLIKELVAGANNFIKDKAPSMIAEDVQGNVRSMLEDPNASNIQTSKKKNFSGQKSVQKQTLDNVIGTSSNSEKGASGLRKAIEELSNVSQGYADAERLSKIVDVIESEIKKLTHYARKRENDEKDSKYHYILSETDSKAENYLLSLEELSKPNSAFSEFEFKDMSILDAINYVISYFSKRKSQTLGDVFEYLILAASEAFSKNVLNKSCEDIVSVIKNVDKTKILGGKVSYSGISKVTIDPRIMKALQQGSTPIKKYAGYNDDDIPMIYAMKPSQEKIDCEIILDNTKAYVSAKNYSFEAAKARSEKDGLNYTAMHLLSGAPMFTLLQSEPANFVNQYLNVLVPHYEVSRGYFEDSANKKDKKARTYENNKIVYTKELDLMNIVIADLISLKALTGFGLQRGYVDDAGKMTISDMNTSNVFIISDRDHKNVKVYNAGDFFLKGIASGGFKIHNLPTSDLWPKPYGTRLKISNRIADIILKVHKQKINVNFDIAKLPLSIGGLK